MYLSTWDHLVAETPPDSRTSTDLHLISIFAGDQEIGAMIAAAHEGLRFQIRSFIGSLGEKPVVYRASLQIQDGSARSGTESCCRSAK
jgi:hypothetical protein